MSKEMFKEYEKIKEIIPAIEEIRNTAWDILDEFRVLNNEIQGIKEGIWKYDLEHPWTHIHAIKFFLRKIISILRDKIMKSDVVKSLE